MRHRLWPPFYFAIAGLALLGMAVPASAQLKGLDDLTGPWQLFVDDSIVAAKNSVTRTYHPFQKYAGNPVLTPTQAWEESIAYIYGTVMPNESLTGYRMWYHTMRPLDTANDGSNILYAESTNGINWTKPNLGIRSWHGSTANNMIFVRPGQSGITSVMHTPWDPDPNKQYRLMNYEASGYWGAYSNDGVHTFDLPNNPVFTQAGDVGQFMYDPHTNLYRGYVKVNSTVNGLQRRSLALTSTTEINAWPAPQLILEVDTYDDRWVPAGTVQRSHIYGMGTFAYESMYIGLMWIFRATDVDGYYIGPVFTEIASSRDGVSWTREEAPRPAMLPLGSTGAWDDGQLYTAKAPIRVGNELWIYYGACDDVHGTATKKLHCSIGLATMRKDGFASLDAGTTAGSVTTRKLIGASGPLHVNYKTNSGGSIKVEVLDTNGNVMPGYSQADCSALAGDSIDQVVTWTTHPELPGGFDPISLRFIVQNGSVYSFNPGEAASIVVGPVITQQPQPQTVCPGETATFSVQATGAGSLIYQWRKNGVDLTNGGHYADVTTATLTVSNIDATDAASYACLVSDLLDSTASAAATLALGTTAISQHPSNQMVSEGQAAVFTVAAAGKGTILYQWQKNNGNLTNGGHYSGATTSTLTIATADAGDAAEYRCVATGDCGSATSNVATLAVMPPSTACVNNGGFERGFTSGTATGWTKFNLVGNVTCAATTTSIRTGGYAQQVYSPNISNTGGVYQQIAVTPGQQYTVKVYVKTSNANVMEGYLGVDPAGGTNYANVPEQYKDFTSYTTWSQQTVTVTATSNRITVFLHARSTKAAVDGYVYFDDATPDCPTVAPDLDQDWDVDGDDLTLLLNCVAGPMVPFMSGCDSRDFDGDGDVDQDDFALFQRCYAGAGQPADPNCAD